MYVCNMHWDKVDNFRIDKYLMLLRMQLKEVLDMLKVAAYKKEVMVWFNNQIARLFVESNLICKGIPLQICDVFLQELNKVDAENISYVNLAALLEPFLGALGNCRNKILLQRI